MEDEKLVRRLQKGSRTALEQVINRYTAYVSTIVWRTLGAAATREDTEEAVSDVFLSLWSHAHELDPKQGLRPWLGTVARNRAADCLRRAKPTVPLAEDDGPSPAEGPEETAAAKDQAERLWQAVALGKMLRMEKLSKLMCLLQKTICEKKNWKKWAE